MRGPLLCLFLCLTVGSSAASLENRLVGHASPYLAMHAADPVHWQDWGPEVLAQARRAGKLVFVSSGYFACHWCHVMQRESYRDAAIAALLNAHFIPVKLDRELHPALDAHLIDFVERTRGSAGWPLNVVLTPEGYPLLGMVYVPPADLQRVLEQLHDLWQGGSEGLRALARDGATQRAREPMAMAPAPALPAAALRGRLIGAALDLGDDFGGGFGRQSRFPMVPQLQVLLELQAAEPQPPLATFLTLTLDQMAREGLRDHLAGGFFRYTVDPGWQVPHYEKMLYTQALLARLYLRAATVLGRPDYRAVAVDTLDFVLARLAAPGGGYGASLSAIDAAGVEGGAYLWDDDQLAAVLDADALALARRHWRLQGTPATAGGYLPRQGEAAEVLAAASGEPPLALRERLEDVRKRLLVARDRRTPPRDDKVLSGWNGLLLGALAEAARELDQPRYAAAATALAGHLLATAWTGTELLRAPGPAGPLGAAALEDYAYLADGLDRLGRLPGRAADLQTRDALLSRAWEAFYDPVGGWRQDDAGGVPGMAIQPALPDGPMPSPTAVIVRLSAASGAAGLQARARAAQALARPLVQDDPFWHATAALGLIQSSAVAHAGAVHQ